MKIKFTPSTPRDPIDEIRVLQIRGNARTLMVHCQDCEHHAACALGGCLRTAYTEFCQAAAPGKLKCCYQCSESRACGIDRAVAEGRIPQHFSACPRWPELQRSTLHWDVLVGNQLCGAA